MGQREDNLFLSTSNTDLLQEGWLQEKTFMFSSKTLLLFNLEFVKDK